MTPDITLNNGIKIPSIGFGVWRTPEGGEVEQSVLWALEAGYRLIDTAKIYGNETGVGEAIRRSGLSREEVFVTTKLWNEDQGYSSALKAIDESLEKLGMDYVDLYLVHWPFASWPLDAAAKVPNQRKETWKAMEEILASRKAKAIGVSNYTISHLEEMKNYANITPAINQVEFHPFLHQKELLQYCKGRGVVVEAYCPLIHGEKINDPRITEVAKKYAKSNAQILLRWSVQHGCIPLPKSTNQNRIKENISIFDFELSSEDMETLDDLHENFRVTSDPSSINP